MNAAADLEIPQPCRLCNELILPAEVNEPCPGLHYECAMRAVIGSVAHIERRCSCFVAGSTEEDPPGLSKREAARAAVACWQKRNAAVVVH